MNAYSFTAGADYRVYAATLTGISGAFADTLIDFIASDGTTMPETDDENDVIGSGLNISRAVLAIAGTHYVRVRQLNTAPLFGPTRSYDFYVRVLRGPRPAMAEQDPLAIAVNGGDMVVTIVDVDAERDAAEWKAFAGIGVFNGSFVMINGD